MKEKTIPPAREQVARTIWIKTLSTSQGAWDANLLNELSDGPEEGDRYTGEDRKSHPANDPAYVCYGLLRASSTQTEGAPVDTPKECAKQGSVLQDRANR